MKDSPLFTISWRDALHGLIMAVATPALYIIEQTAETGTLHFNWMQISSAALAGGVAYLFKKFLTPATPIKEVTKTDDGTVVKTVIDTDTVKVEIPKV